MEVMATDKNKSELQFEQEVITYLTQIGGVKQWEYHPEITTSDHLWSNFKRIVEQNNQARLTEPLSTTEFNQVKKVISELRTPYQAGQFLYGVNGVSEVEVDLDNGKHVFLTIFDQAQVGAGSTVYQVVNQIKRPKIIDGKQDRRFDITLLINGLPIIQIELKKAMHSTNESLNQMEQYIAEKQYGDIFSTTQILIAMTPYQIKYMANTTANQFNKAFTFDWQEEDNAQPVRSWKQFSDKVLSIPMAHDLATRYMILDGTKNKECIKVMRPYQVYATKRSLNKVATYDFNHQEGRLGYIWHTTGSGKTITSFKTAWLASRMPNVDKVVFLVDRIALTSQTVDAYKAYDPIAGFEGKSGVVNNTANINDLHRKFSKKSDKNIIVTSIQKMSRYVDSKIFKQTNDHILFIVDVAHRSTGNSSRPKKDGKSTDGMLESIRKAIPNAGWIGYTGTPKFPETREIFGDNIHTYTIKEAIADKNVLGFKVEFKETIEPPKDPSAEDIDDNIRASVYDTSEDHVQLVVKDILDNWQSRSSNRKYNALFTVHVGGNKPSIPRAMEYFEEFVKENAKREPEKQLKIAVSFSQDTSNSNSQLSTNQGLHSAINNYNQLFNTSWDMKTVKEYTEDLAARLKKTADDGQYLDLVIVVDQLLTGFDAPELNTLYVDRTLKGSNLIQAYSRTNRLHDRDAKPYGNVVNYRWPKQNEYEMNEAFAIYSDRLSAAEQQSLEELIEKNQDAGIIAKPFKEVEAEMQELVQELDELTNHFMQLPPSEKQKEDLFEKLKDYNRLLNQLKQYTEDDDHNPISAYDEPEEFYQRLGLTEDQEVLLTTVLADELKDWIVEHKEIDISEVNLSMVHIHDVRINYDYLVELISRMANEINANQMAEAEKTREEIQVEIAKSDNEQEKSKMRNFVDRVFDKQYTFDQYPVSKTKDEMDQAMDQAQGENNIRLLTAFIRKWGLDTSTNARKLEQLIAKHKLGDKGDMDNRGEITHIMNNAKKDYPEIADAEIATLSWLNYRKTFRLAFYELADEIKRNE